MYLCFSAPAGGSAIYLLGQPKQVRRYTTRAAEASTAASATGRSRLIKWLERGSYTKILGIPYYLEDYLEETREESNKFWEELYTKIKVSMANLRGLKDMKITGRALVANFKVFSRPPDTCVSASARQSRAQCRVREFCCKILFVEVELTHSSPQPALDSKLPQQSQPRRWVVPVGRPSRAPSPSSRCAVPARRARIVRAVPALLRLRARLPLPHGFDPAHLEFVAL